MYCNDNSISFTGKNFSEMTIEKLQDRRVRRGKTSSVHYHQKEEFILQNVLHNVKLFMWFIDLYAILIRATSIPFS